MQPRRFLIAVCLYSAIAPPQLAQAVAPLTTQTVTSGLTLPLYVTAPPGDTNRLFIVEQRSGSTGRIRIFKKGGPTPGLVVAPYLSVPNVSTGSEQGLLGLAFHPDYSSNGYFYVNYTSGAGAGSTFIRRYQVSGDADLANTNGTPVLSYSQPQTNHNGGWIGFGPDGYLYIASGDGGNSNDTGAGHTTTSGNAQDITSNLLGKLLRIDVNGDDFGTDGNRNYAIPASNPMVSGPLAAGDDEIWDYGLRNPWRCAFDRLTGDLYIADVGQNVIEEVDFEPAGMGGRNYGWRCLEGNTCTGLTGCDCNTNNTPSIPRIPPVHTYTHAQGCSITGGYCYRGSAIPSLQGTYFFADYCDNTIWSFRLVSGVVTEFTDRTTQLDPPGPASIVSITSFGEDADGEMYIVDQGGEVFKIVANCTIAVSQNPAPVSTCEGLPASFTGAASGISGAPSYQWLKNGAVINGATSATYLIASVTAGDAGAYRLRVTDNCNEVTTNPATLTVTGPQPAGDLNDDCVADPGDVPIFVNVLLGADGDPGHVDGSDLNDDGKVDGDDIDLFVEQTL